MGDAQPQSSSLLELLPRRPAVAAAICLMLGISAHRVLAPRPEIWLAATTVAAIGALLMFRCERACSIAIATALIFVGASSAQLAAFFYPTNDISQFTSNRPRIAHLKVRISDPPHSISNRSPFRTSPMSQVARGEVLGVFTARGWRRASGTILLHISEPLPELRIQQTVELTGLLHRPAVAANPGEFDWSAYYRQDRILAACSVPKRDIQILLDPTPSWLDHLRAKARALLDAGFLKSQSLDHALLRALVLGDSDPELRDVQEDFRRTGTSHHLAISGMHVAILGGLIYLLCRLLLIRPRLAIALALSFVLLYGLVVLPSPPVVRAVILCCAFGIGLSLRRNVDTMQLLALTVIVMLVYHPLDLYGAGFQLSFGTVCGLILFTRRVEERLFPPDRDDEVALALLGAQAPIGLRLKRWFRRHLSGIVAAGVVAWLISMPLVLLHFEQLNPWAVFASILLAPFVLAALVAGFLKIILTLLIPSLAPSWATGAASSIALMRHVLALLAQLPGSDFPIPSPPIWLVVVLYALLLIPLLPMKRLRQFTRHGFATAAVAIVLLPFGAGLSSFWHEPKLTVTTLSVGAGLCNVIELPDGSAVMIDAGSSTISDVHRRILEPFLRHEAQRNIQCIFLSHRDYDHISAAGQVVERFNVRRIFVPSEFERLANEPAHDLLALLSELHRPAKPLRAGDLVPLSQGAIVKVLWPPESCPFDANNTGLVLRLTYAGHSILFPADIQADAETALLRHPEKLRSDILIAPHHGSAERTTAAFIQAVHPKLIISSNDHSLTQKQRRFNRIAAGYQLDRTDQSGAVTVTITRSGKIDIATFLHGN